MQMESEGKQGFTEKIRQAINERRLTTEEENEEKRSPGAVIAEKILRAVNDGHLSSVEGSEEFLQKRAAEEDNPLPVIKPLLNRENGDVTDFHGMQLITFGTKEDSAYTVLYTHGGGYTEEIQLFHMQFCKKLAERLKAYVLVPIYPLAPNHIWKETYDLLTALYNSIITIGHYYESEANYDMSGRSDE